MDMKHLLLALVVAVSPVADVITNVGVYELLADSETD
jgi:hypothetical protein